VLNVCLSFKSTMSNQRFGEIMIARKSKPPPPPPETRPTADDDDDQEGVEEGVGKGKKRKYKKEKNWIRAEELRLAQWFEVRFQSICKLMRNGGTNDISLVKRRLHSRFLVAFSCARWRRSADGRVRVRLHVSESAYKSPYDSVPDLYANRIGIQFFFGHPLQWFVNTF
jgi:hypothetical protein